MSCSTLPTVNEMHIFTQFGCILSVLFYLIFSNVDMKKKSQAILKSGNAFITNLFIHNGEITG